MARIIVLADTHVTSLRQLPAELVPMLHDADWVVHCGDFTGPALLDELRQMARNFAGVYGNTDPAEIRLQLPRETTIEIEGKSIAVTHPYWGGPSEGLEQALLTMFPHADAVLFGHTHDPAVLTLNGKLLLNPGQGYSMFILRATIGVLTVTPISITGEILRLG